MADASAVALQNAVNRFAASLGFSKLVVDGVIGAKTLAATQRTLDYILGLGYSERRPSQP